MNKELLINANLLPEVCLDYRNVASLMRILSWLCFTIITYFISEQKCELYAQNLQQFTVRAKQHTCSRDKDDSEGFEND